MNFGCGVNTIRRETCLTKPSRQRHGKTTGMGSANQFFGIGARTGFKTGRKRVGPLKRPTAQFHGALTFF
jgi:hypothetical protein